MTTLHTILSVFVKPCQFFNIKLFNIKDDGKTSKAKAILNWFVNMVLLYGLIGVYIFLVVHK